MPREPGAQPVFYYDLGSPDCYLAAEQIMSALPVVPEWEPVHLDHDPEIDRERIERAAADLGLQPMRWPPRLPPDTRQAMLAATPATDIKFCGVDDPTCEACQ